MQGRVDASQQWKILIETVLIGEMGIVPNRADACMHSGRVAGDVFIVGRATDNFLVATTPPGCAVFLQALCFTILEGEARWKIHDYGLATMFYGIRIVRSDDAITMDQRLFASSLVASVLGDSWLSQLVPSGKHKTPLPTGSAFEAKMAGEIPLTAPELLKVGQVWIQILTAPW